MAVSPSVLGGADDSAGSTLAPHEIAIRISLSRKKSTAVTGNLFHWWLSPFLASRRLRRRVVRACLARHEVNYGRSFFHEGQCVAAASAVEVTGLGFVDQLAQQAASANAEGAHDRCHAPLVAAPLTPELFYAAKHLSVHATLLKSSRSRALARPPRKRRPCTSAVLRSLVAGSQALAGAVGARSDEVEIGGAVL